MRNQIVDFEKVQRFFKFGLSKIMFRTAKSTLEPDNRSVSLHNSQITLWLCKFKTQVVTLEVQRPAGCPKISKTRLWCWKCIIKITILKIKKLRLGLGNIINPLMILKIQKLNRDFEIKKKNHTMTLKVLQPDFDFASSKTRSWLRNLVVKQIANLQVKDPGSDFESSNTSQSPCKFGS